MSHWIRICSTADCPPGTAREFVLQDRVVALVCVAGEFYALDGICPHQGGPLGRGRLEGCLLTCPWHGWQFDVRDGRHRTIPSLSQPTLPVRVEGAQVLVQLEA